MISNLIPKGISACSESFLSDLIAALSRHDLTKASRIKERKTFRGTHR